VQFKLKSGKIIEDSDYGKTLSEMGVQNCDIINVNKLAFQEPAVVEARLIDPATN
jgi:hypothetical protein